MSEYKWDEIIFLQNGKEVFRAPLPKYSTEEIRSALFRFSGLEYADGFEIHTAGELKASSYTNITMQEEVSRYYDNREWQKEKLKMEIQMPTDKNKNPILLTNDDFKGIMKELCPIVLEGLDNQDHSKNTPLNGVRVKGGGWFFRCGNMAFYTDDAGRKDILKGIKERGKKYTPRNPNRPEPGQPELNNMNTQSGRVAIGEVVILKGEEGQMLSLDNEFKYIGTKQMHAYPMSLGAYNKFRGWTVPADEDAKRIGYIVRYEDGYISWSPKEVFEANYRQTAGMNFGLAIEAMKKGLKVYRSGWNGKGMYLWLLPATEVKKEWVKDPMLLSVFGERDILPCLGSIRMLTATGEVLTGWLASQTDILADDWCIVT